MFGLFAELITSRVNRLLHRDPNFFLKKGRGVIHVGANEGQERDLYASLGLPVIWVEPIPEVYAKLVKNIAPHQNQKACHYLLSDRDDKAYDLHIANNNGASSSILEFHQHAEIWPEVHFTHSIRLTSVTLPTLIASEGIDLAGYDVLVLDTQGSELLILQGAASLLGGFHHVKLEVPDFEAYKGCGTLAETSAFMRQQGFAEIHRNRFAGSSSSGFYYDIVYRNLQRRR